MGLLGKIKKVGSSGLIGGLTGAGGARAARRGARAQQQALRQGINTLDETYDDQFNLLNPQAQIGNQALAQYGQLFGIGTGANGANGAPDYSQFFESPGYQFTQQQGEQGIGRMQSARGNLFSGGAGKELNEYNNGLASQGYNDYANRLGAFANLGPQTNQLIAGYMGQRGQGVANLQSGIGDARASGIVGAANSYSNAASNILNFVSSIYGGKGSAQGLNAGVQQSPSANTYDPSQFRFNTGY